MTWADLDATIATPDGDTSWGDDLRGALSTVRDHLDEIVFHGADATVARPPTTGSVLWIGSVEPTNWVVDDLWYDTVAETVGVSVGDTGWTLATYQNGWTSYGGDYGPARFRKDANGWVHLDGLVNAGTVGSGTPIFTLPVGYRPSTQQLCAVQSNGALGRVDVFKSGAVACMAGSNAWVSLANLHFLAEA